METKQLQVVQIPVDLIDPCAWNVNRMSEEMADKLAAYIEREGLVEPIVVRRKGTEGRYEIIGGEHRWRICKGRLGFSSMPCVVVDVDDRRARIMSVNLNEMSGQALPARLASLIHELNRETSLEDLERLLPYERAEMADMLNLLRLPEGLEQRLEEEAKRQDEETPVIVSIALTRAQHATFDSALERVRVEIGDGAGWKGRALERMARAYVSTTPPDPPGPDGGPAATETRR